MVLGEIGDVASADAAAAAFLALAKPVRDLVRFSPAPQRDGRAAVADVNADQGGNSIDRSPDAWLIVAEQQRDLVAFAGASRLEGFDRERVGWLVDCPRHPFENLEAENARHV